MMCSGDAAMAKERAGREGELYRSVGAEIRRRRERLRTTQDELALQVGLSRASVANVEAGRQAVPLHLLVDIASALGAELADLVPAGSGRGTPPVALSTETLPSAVRAFAERALRARP